MGKLKNFLLVGFLSAYALVGAGQDYMGCDYVRELRVNRESANYDVRKDDFISYGKIEFNDPLQDEAKNCLEGKVLNIYFPTSVSELSNEDKSDIRRYFLHYINPNSKWVNVDGFNVAGFADFRGNVKSNYDLSAERAENVLAEMRKFRPQARFFVSAYGESRSVESTDSVALQKDRVVRVTPNEKPMKFALDFCPADIYLLDQSGSMNLNGEWNMLRQYRFPDSSNVFSFSLMSGEKEGYNYDINLDGALGNTSYYLALDTLLSSVENKTITTMINGGDNVGGATVEEIVRKANERNVILNVVGMNLGEKDERDLLNLAEKTGGKYYLFNEFK